jgi:hypothetical protein
MRYGIRIATLALCGLLLACATKYQNMNFLGGVDATQIDSNTFRISAKGNAYTRSDRIQNYALMKAAETTLSSGNDYFVILGSQDTTRRGVDVTPGKATSTTTITGGIATAETHYSDPDITEYVKPGQDLMIRVFKGAKPKDNAAAFDAHEVVSFLGPKVKS